MDATGKIVEVGQVQQISDRFRKRDIVLEIATNPQYPEYVQFQFVQDRCDLLDNMQPGQTATIHFDLRGRKWTNPQGEVRYFNTLQGWRIQLEGAQQQRQAAPPVDSIPPPPEFTGGQVDEIPF